MTVQRIVLSETPREATPLEKSEGIVYQQGIYGPDGRLIPFRKDREAQVRRAIIDSLVARGAKVEETAQGLKVTPPYPEGANRHVRRLIDKEWEDRLNKVLKSMADARRRTS